MRMEKGKRGREGERERGRERGREIAMIIIVHEDGEGGERERE